MTAPPTLAEPIDAAIDSNQDRRSDVGHLQHRHRHHMGPRHQSRPWRRRSRSARPIQREVHGIQGLRRLPQLIHQLGHEVELEEGQGFTALYENYLETQVATIQLRLRY